MTKQAPSLQANQTKRVNPRNAAKCKILSSILSFQTKAKSKQVKSRPKNESTIVKKQAKASIQTKSKD